MMSRIYIFIVAVLIPHMVSAKLEDEIKGAQVGYLVTEIASGRVVAAHNATLNFVPASTLKCITAAAALTHAGASYRFETMVTYNGYLRGDTLDGSLYISGQGDPSLGEPFSRSLREHIAMVTGRIVIDGSQPYVSPTAMVEDIGTEYGVGWSTLNYRCNECLVNDSLKALPFERIRDDLITDLYLNGITTLNNETDTTLTIEPLMTYKSAPLDTLCRHMMVESDNLYAQSLGRLLSPTLDIDGAIDSLATFVNNTAPHAGAFRLADMSGLSRANLISPRLLTEILTSMKSTPGYVGSFPRAGRDGTVKRFLKSSTSPGHFLLKSGSMSGVLCYAGYKTDRTGKPTHTIVIFTNNFTSPHSVVKQCIERWLLKISL